MNTLLRRWFMFSLIAFAWLWLENQGGAKHVVTRGGKNCYTQGCDWWCIVWTDWANSGSLSSGVLYKDPIVWDLKKCVHDKHGTTPVNPADVDFWSATGCATKCKDDLFNGVTTASGCQKTGDKQTAQGLSTKCDP